MSGNIKTLQIQETSDIRFRKRRFDRCAIFESASRPGKKLIRFAVTQG